MGAGQDSRTAKKVQLARGDTNWLYQPTTFVRSDRNSFSILSKF